MLNNFLMLKEKEKDECIWYSEAIRKRDLIESEKETIPIKRKN